MGKSIDERSHEAIRAYLRHRGIEVLEEGWAHGSDGIDFIAMDDEELVFVDAATKYEAPGLWARGRSGVTLLYVAYPCLISLSEVDRKF